MHSYQKAFDEIRSIVAHRRDAIYHQQAINEALVTALDFCASPSTMELVAALKSKKIKSKPKEAKLKLKARSFDKYFASVPFPEVERMVAKEMLKTYANYIPEENESTSSKSSIPASREVSMPSSMHALNILFLAILKNFEKVYQETKFV